MPDTGAPWNLRFPSPSDLVRNGPAQFENLADDVAAGLSAAANAGIGSNVVQAVKTDTFTLSITTNYTDVTGLSATITPSSDTAKILVVCYVHLSIESAAAAGGFIRLTGGNSENFVGAASGSRVQSAGFIGLRTSANYEVSRGIIPHTVFYLDSPATASAVTYKLQARTQGGELYVNRMGDDSNAASRPSLASSITAIEVAA